ncbi:MAG: hypothetical protein PHX00_11770 [Synergistaceae bacterium]|nr:hypothetical protein [Synergistaceae bacterium]
MGIPSAGRLERGVVTGEGDRPPLWFPPPNCDIHHGPVHKGTLEKSRIRLPTGYTHARLFPDIASTASLPESGGAGWGVPEKRMDIPFE